MNTPPRRTRTARPVTPTAPRLASTFEEYSPRRSLRLKDLKASPTVTIGTLSPPPSSPLAASPSPKQTKRRTTTKRATFALDEKPGAAKGKGKGKAVFVLNDEEEGKEEESKDRAYARPTLRNAGAAGLPTPRKTPSRKRKLAPEQVASSAQALFPPTEATSSKSTSASKGGLFGVRRSRATSTSIAPTNTPRHKSAAGTITVEEETETSIEIFTDSVERRPTFDADPDNPFISRPGDETRSTKKTRQQRADRSRNRLGNAGERSDGMVYIFRGKRVFKSFSKLPDTDDRAGSEDVDEEGEGLNPTEVKPRLLFPGASPATSKAKNGLKDSIIAEEEEVDEEAETDIDDMPQSQTSSIIVKTRKAGGRLSVSRMTPESEDEIPGTTTKVSSFKARLAAAAVAASSSSASSSKKRLSSSKALFDDGEDDAWHQTSASKGGFVSDDEVPASSSKTRGVKRGIAETGLTTPASTVRKRTRRTIY